MGSLNTGAAELHDVFSKDGVTFALDRPRRVAEIRFSRPDRRNALDQPAIDALLHILQSLKDDPAVLAVTMAGEGSAFCAGMDLKNTAPGSGPTQAGGSADPILARLAVMERGVAVIETSGRCRSLSSPRFTGPLWAQDSPWPPLATSGSAHRRLRSAPYSSGSASREAISGSPGFFRDS